MAFAPAALGIFSSLAGLAGAGVSALGSLFGGQSQAAMFQYQSAIAQLNANIAGSNAEYASNAGATQAAETGMQTRAQIGSTRAIQGASNIAVGSGSAPAVVSSERQIGDINVANVVNNAARVAYGYTVQQQADTIQSKLDLAGASNSVTAGTIGAVSSLLSGAGSVASKWIQMGQSGMFGPSGSPATPSGAPGAVAYPGFYGAGSSTGLGGPNPNNVGLGN